MRSVFPTVFCLLLLSSVSVSQERKGGEFPPAFGLILTPESGFDGNPKEMMKTFLADEISVAKKAWIERYEKLKTVEDVKIYADERRRLFRERLGEFWERSPLNSRITNRFEKGEPGKNAYRVETVIFESVPNFYVTGVAFVPDETRFKPPYPAVLVVCGHNDEGKASERGGQFLALAATHGLLAFSIDPIDQGERSQRLTADGKPAARGVPAHNIIGAGSILLGRNAATFEVWDMIRAIDYLQSRPDVLPDKIGATGASGGGTQSSYIITLDDRIAVAAPACYLCDLFDLSITLGPQDAEQNIFGQFAFGMDHADYCILNAPKPILIATATDDFFPVEGAWSAYRYAKRIYDRFGYAEKMSLIEHDGRHRWHKNLREATVRWMLRWLAGRDEQIFEADNMPAVSKMELLATPKGEVLQLEGARSTFDLNRDYSETLLAERNKRNEKRSAEEFAAVVRERIGCRPLADIPPCSVESKGMLPPPPVLTEVASNVEKLVVATENGRIHLPALRYSPRSAIKGSVILLHENGKSADLARIAVRLHEGLEVLAIDLRGLGETQAFCAPYFQHAMFGPDGTDYYLAYLLGKSYVGMRAEDLLSVARWHSSEKQGMKPMLDATGDTVGVAALHAAVVEPARFSKVVLAKPVRSWHDVVQAGASFYPISNLVHGVLIEYDIPDLVERSGAVVE